MTNTEAKLIARRVRGGSNEADSIALLHELVAAGAGRETLAYGLYYHGFATIAGSDRYSAELLEA